MKLVDLREERLDELDLSRPIAAFSLALAALSYSPDVDHVAPPTSKTLAQAMKDLQVREADVAKLVATVAKTHMLDPGYAAEIVQAAKKYEKKIFPRAEDIIALVGIESRFKPKAKSKLKNDPAVGLTQVRPKIWKIPAEELHTIDGSIKHGVAILDAYYQKLGTPEAALQAYNLGITRYRKATSDAKAAGERYLNKFNKERALYPKTT